MYHFEPVMKSLTRILLSVSLFCVSYVGTTPAFSDVSQEKLDILMVIDNSGSMAEYHEKLSDKINFLFHFLKDIDWQLNIITTDSPCSVSKLLPMDAANLDTSLLSGIINKTGITGSADEKPLTMTMQHLQNNGGSMCSSPATWLRKDAKVAVIIETDEDENVSGAVPGYGDAQDFLFDMQNLGYKPSNNIRVYGIINMPSRPCPITATSVSTIVEQVVQDTDGKAGSICTVNFAPSLLRFSHNLRAFALEKK